MIERIELDWKIRNSESFTSFWGNILNFIHPSENSVFLCNNTKGKANAKGIQLLARLRLGLSHSQEHKYKHKFQDTGNPICSCGKDIETSCHYLLHCSLYTSEKFALLKGIQDIDNSILELSDLQIVEVHLHGKKILKYME